MALSDNTLKLLDIGVKGIFATVVTVLVTLYGMRLQSQSEARAQSQEQFQQRLNFNQQRAQEVISLETQQKDLDVKIAEDMFQSLTASYFSNAEGNKNGESVRRRLLLLNLVALNFQDVPIQLRPLFEDLDQHLTRPEDKLALRSIALGVARRQAFRVTLNGIYNSGPLTVTPGMKIPISALDSTTYVKIDQVSPQAVSAEIVSGLALAGSVGPFDVGYFSWPITDNTKLQAYRLAVMLLEGGEKQASIRIIAFDSDLAPDRFDIKELGKQLRQKDHTTQ